MNEKICTYMHSGHIFFKLLVYQTIELILKLKFNIFLYIFKEYKEKGNKINFVNAYIFF